MNRITFANQFRSTHTSAVFSTLAILISLLIFSVLPAQAEVTKKAIFKCLTSDGQKLYQDRPCKPQEKSTQMRLLERPTLLPAELEAIEIAAENEFESKTSSSRRIGTSRHRQNATRANHSVRRPTNGPRKGNNRRLHTEAQVYRAGCPETYEQSGVYVIDGNTLKLPEGAQMKSYRAEREAYMHYKSLPSKTYLKNQGLWPAHCD